MPEPTADKTARCAPGSPRFPGRREYRRKLFPVGDAPVDTLLPSWIEHALNTVHDFGRRRHTAFSGKHAVKECVGAVLRILKRFAFRNKFEALWKTCYRLAWISIPNNDPRHFVSPSDAMKKRLWCK
jgi:hypothetical protein